METLTLSINEHTMERNRLLKMNFIKRVFRTLFFVLFLFPSCREKPLEPDEMKDAAGNRYKTVTIGNQVWMAENLNALYINKSNKSNYLDDAIEADFWYPDYDPSTMSTYGLLYSLSAAKALLPKGWRIPALRDFEKLLAELRSNYDNGSNAVIHALKINFYPGTNEQEFFTIDKYFSLLMDEPALSVSFDFLTIRIHARDYPDDEIFQSKIYTCNATRDFASSVRFIKDAD